MAVLCLDHLNIPDSNFHGAHMGPTWVLAAPGGPHVGPMNLAIRDRKRLVLNGINGDQVMDM